MSEEKTGLPPEPSGQQDNAQVDASRSGDRVSRLRRQSRMGGWGLGAFVLVSVLAIPDSYLLPALSRSVREFLGAAPPSNLISVALIVYAFSALTLILARIAQGSGSYKGWSHLFYLTSFYVFFGFAGTLRETYWAVFVSGLIIMGLENYLIRTWVNEEIRKKERRIERGV